MIAERQQFNCSSDEYVAAPRVVRIALLGCGTVGGATAQLLISSRQRLLDSHGVDLRIVSILVRDVQRARDGIDPGLFVSDLEAVRRSKPDLAIEVLGGCEPARAVVSRLLERGVSVVTANKTLVAHHGPELQAIADRCGAGFAFEASVGAAIPVLAALRQRAGDPVIALRAVLNGTCNFILQRMRESGCAVESAVAQAIDRGYAEPDPSADLSGRDTAEKLCILARAAGFAHVQPGDVSTSGIERITPRDLDAAREQGCVVKLVAEMEAAAGAGPRLRVSPMFVPFTHPLARAKDAQNVIVLDQEFAGRLTLQGEGAGPKPTAAAILGDVLDVLEAPVQSSRVACPHAAPLSPSSRRMFVRLPRACSTESVLLRRASQVHVLRDATEAIVEASDEIPMPAEAFVAPMLRA